MIITKNVTKRIVTDTFGNGIVHVYVEFLYAYNIGSKRIYTVTKKDPVRFSKDNYDAAYAYAQCAVKPATKEESTCGRKYYRMHTIYDKELAKKSEARNKLLGEKYATCTLQLETSMAGLFTSFKTYSPTEYSHSLKNLVETVNAFYDRRISDAMAEREQRRKSNILVNKEITVVKSFDDSSDSTQQMPTVIDKSRVKLIQDEIDRTLTYLNTLKHLL